MSKKSIIQRNLKRMSISNIYKKRRIVLQEKIKNKFLSGEERFSAVLDLQKFPRDSSPVRIRKRCYLSGRGRGVMSKFGLSRIWFRKLSLECKIPGVEKSSW
jgi:small subunit ribosomal protein S14